MSCIPLNVGKDLVLVILICSHDVWFQSQSILIMGGGQGSIAKEVLLHKNVKSTHPGRYYITRTSRKRWCVTSIRSNHRSSLIYGFIVFILNFSIRNTMKSIEYCVRTCAGALSLNQYRWLSFVVGVWSIPPVEDSCCTRDCFFLDRYCVYRWEVVLKTCAF